MLTPARGSRPWFDNQIKAIRATGATYDDASQVWVRWLDPAEPERLAAGLAEMAAVARDYGATLSVNPASTVLAMNH
ncbi:hypothetical protein [Saccharopolyspora sp. NPDC002376]